MSIDGEGASLFPCATHQQAKRKSARGPESTYTYSVPKYVHTEGGTEAIC
jgi:hypothetical protein